MSDPDVIVVGAGHNGLVAAGYLARAGLRVLVVEAAPHVGGMTVSPAFIPEAPEHRLNLCAVDAVVLRGTTVVADLELQRHGYRELDLDPIFSYLHPDGASVVVFRDVPRTVAEIARFSRRDAAAYAELVRVMDDGLTAALPIMLNNPARPELGWLREAAGGAVRGARRLPAFARLMTGSGTAEINRRFEHPVVRSLLHGIGTFACDMDVRGTGFYLMLLGLAHRFGVGRPVGGLGGLADALRAHLRSRGGDVRTSAPVTGLTMSGRRVTGVRLASGEEVGARLGVLTSCDPGQVLLDMLPPGHLGPVLSRGLRTLKRNAAGAGPFKVDLALRGQLRLDRFRRDDGVDLRVPSTFFGASADITAGYAAAARGELVDRLPGYAVIPTAADPSQAPAGQDTLYLYSGATPVDPTVPWSDLAESAAKNLVTHAGQFYDGIEELEIGRHVETWLDLKARTGSGVMTHNDMSVARQGPLRPALGAGGYRGPVGGLWLSGAGTHPGGTVNGISGRLAAATLLRDVAGRR
jgi:phytoene dehydrogenase-like protein